MTQLSSDKLVKICQDFQKKHQVQAKFIAADFQSDPACYERIKKETDSLTVSILVNNAGGGVGRQHKSY
jgi:short-subunit dehydrogenase